MLAAPRTTDDSDVFWVEEGEDFQKARLAMRDGVQAIASKYTLPPHWFNYLTHMLISDKMIMPKGTLWKRYGPLHVYVPPKQYMVALKILAGWEKDMADCRMLLPQTHIRTRKQAQRVLERSTLPDAQQDEAETIEYSTPRAFRIGKWGGAMMPKTIQTMARIYQQICAGENPWTAHGNFTNAWYDYAKDICADLVSEPLGKPEADTAHMRHWGAFCAASVEFLCDRYGIPCPELVQKPEHTLSTPWYVDNIVNPADTGVLHHRLKTSLAPLARRNVFCGNRLYQNTYEMNEWLQEAHSKGMSTPRDIWHYARQKETALHRA